MIYRQKLDSLAYISAAESIGLSSTTFTQSVPKPTEFGAITLRLGVLRRSRSSNVTEFGTNRKLICDFLLVINSNLAPILHRFRVIAFDRSKIAISGYPFVFNSPNRGVSLRRSPQNFTERSWMAKVPNGVETVPKISIVWVGRTNVTESVTFVRPTQTIEIFATVSTPFGTLLCHRPSVCRMSVVCNTDDRHTTDGRTMTYSEAKVNVISPSLKTKYIKWTKTSFVDHTALACRYN